MPNARRLFGTDGVRGVANLEPMSADTVVRLGRAVAMRCRAHAAGRHAIIIGKDTRWSGDLLEAALSAGICAAGVDVLQAGIIPTPAVAVLTRTLGAAAGAVISASHNPFADNGIKFFGADGFKLPDDEENTIEALVRSGTFAGAPTGTEIGRVTVLGDAAGRYVDFLKACAPGHRSLAGVRLVVDCAHGATSHVGPELFRQLGADVVVMAASPNGENINRACGAVYPQALQDAVRAEHAHIGVALDGDGDRAIFVDETGAVVDGDEILAMLAPDMLSRGTLKGQTVVATIMSNLGLELALRDRGVRLIRVQVGDRYVVEEMRRGGYNLGGEQSGHLVFLDHATTGDGLRAALAVLRFLLERQRPLSELKRVMTRLPQALVNVRVARHADFDGIPKVREAIRSVTADLGDRGRVVVRYSGTEPLARVMVEGEHAAHVQACAEAIAASIREELGA